MIKKIIQSPLPYPAPKIPPPIPFLVTSAIAPSFTELTKLRVAGSYYQDGVYYIFSRTNVDPYQYYYRIYNPTNQLWGNWIKIDLAIEANEISAIIQLGRLYIFWTEVERKEINKLSDSKSTLVGYVFKVYVKYSYLNENGKWSEPQRLYIGYIFIDDLDTICRKIWGDRYIVRDDNLDITLKKFQEQVFRKPYLIKNNTSTSLNLYYIWLQGKKATSQTYKTNGLEIEIPTAPHCLPEGDRHEIYRQLARLG